MNGTTKITLWARTDKPEIRVWVKEESSGYSWAAHKSWSHRPSEKSMPRWYSCASTKPEGAACTGGGAVPDNYEQLTECCEAFTKICQSDGTTICRECYEEVDFYC